MDEVGCRKCGKGNGWSIFTDGQGNFEAKHPCGHISKFHIVDRPDGEPGQAIDMRFLV